MHLRVDNAPTRALEVPREADEEDCDQEEDQDDGFVVVEGPGHCGGARCEGEGWQGVVRVGLIAGGRARC
jgi:hypothetical protein